MEGKQIPEVRKHNNKVLRMRCLPIVCTVDGCYGGNEVGIWVETERNPYL